ncbi:glycosyltransferase family 2 protein [Paludisphaera borealis]|uniref:GT2 family glycosyltransferase n=1 Tax=Paludisphaera borealis TaxID=1387353 RepID=A0A1U7CMU1_9BACT|nr:glycosyltransferase family 2 protein [Paludisphaera borealis]APW60252.1 GT2 family glycosyltransferase [Paludisphaera borealis]
MDQQGVTIAIPNWNHEFFLSRSILSALETIRLLKREGIPGEVLVVDDASRDGSESLLRSLEALYGREGLRVLRHETNRGLAAARNSALLNASHRYIVFLDADNYLIEANFPSFLRSIKETGAAVVYGNLLMRRLGEDSAFWMCSNESFQPRIYDENYIDAFALLDRIQILDCGGYTSGVDAWADWELWLHLAASGRRLVFVPLTFGVYQYLPNSMMRAVDDPDAIKPRFKRVFNQLEFRDCNLTRTHHERYFPGVGYL